MRICPEYVIWLKFDGCRPESVVTVIFNSAA